MLQKKPTKRRNDSYSERVQANAHNNKYTSMSTKINITTFISKFQSFVNEFFFREFYLRKSFVGDFCDVAFSCIIQTLIHRRYRLKKAIVLCVCHNSESKQTKNEKKKKAEKKRHSMMRSAEIEIA